MIFHPCYESRYGFTELFAKKKAATEILFVLNLEVIYGLQSETLNLMDPLPRRLTIFSISLKLETASTTYMLFVSISYFWDAYAGGNSCYKLFWMTVFSVSLKTGDCFYHLHVVYFHFLFLGCLCLRKPLLQVVLD